jgi:hypothetical protein
MFRFTIRELILLTLIVAMGLGWGVDRSRLARDLNRLSNYSGQWYMQLIFSGIKPYDGPNAPFTWGR